MGERAASPTDRGRGGGAGLLSEFDPDAFEPEGIAPSADLSASTQPLAAELPVDRVLSAPHGLPIDRSIDPARVMDRALLAWGAGHIAMGSRAGWVLLVAEIAWLAALASSLSLLETDRWLLIYALLASFLVIWIAQAAAAQRAACRRAGRTGGAVRLVAIVPVMIAVLSAFWLLGGRTASPAGTFERYVTAWETSDPGGAAGLFVTPSDAAALQSQWVADTEVVTERVGQLDDSHQDWDLDAQHPFANLHFEYTDGPPGDGADQVTMAVQIVRVASVPGTFLGILPSIGSETQVVATVGRATLVRVAVDSPWPFDASIWLIQSVHVGGEGD